MLSIGQDYNSPELQASAELLLGKAASQLEQSETDVKGHFERAIAVSEKHHLIHLAVPAYSVLGDDVRAKELAQEHGLKA